LVIGAAIAVHAALGSGYVEKIYEEALCLELARRGTKFERQKRVQVKYLDQVVGEFVLDLFVESRLVVEMKAADAIHPIHLAQTISYIRTVNEPLGLILNFHVALMKDGIKRVVWSK
jgi:GxxExxY protein